MAFEEMTLAHPNLKSYYYKHRQFHRHKQDIKIAILNQLLIHGPTPITKLCYIIQISHAQANRFINELIEDGFALSLSVKDLHLGRKKKALPEELKHLPSLNANVKGVSVITPLGRNYLHKCNRIDAMIHWKESEGK